MILEEAIEGRVGQMLAEGGREASRQIIRQY